MRLLRYSIPGNQPHNYSIGFARHRGRAVGLQINRGQRRYTWFWTLCTRDT